MEFQTFFESPFVLKFSFEKLIQKIEHEASINANYATSHRALLEKVEHFPELRNGIRSLDFFDKNEALMKELLQDLFPPFLTENEIKAIGFPFYNFFFNPTERFQKILKNAGENFDIFIRGLDSQRFYAMSCCIILRNYYNIPINFAMPFIFDIPNEQGIINYYRCLNNIDFVEVKPLQNFEELSAEEIQELLDNFEDYELWKEKFPPNSWELKGFAVITLYDATIESAISNLKSKLINLEDDKNLKLELNSIFRSIFQVPDLELGYTSINFQENKFVWSPINGIIDSFILSNLPKNYHSEMLSEKNFNTLVESKKYFCVSDIEKACEDYPESYLVKHFAAMGIRSAIFAPIVKDKKILGIVELISRQKSLNSVVANKMEIVMPYLEDTMERLYVGIETRIEAIIQREYTTIHPSVYWKFRQEAERHIVFFNEEFDLPYRNISFENLTPLFGQTDLRNSSVARNIAIKKDLEKHLRLILDVIKKLNLIEKEKPIVERIKSYRELLKSDLRADWESQIVDFVHTEIHPLFDSYRLKDINNNLIITDYFKNLDEKSHLVYEARKKFDDSLSYINKGIADILDKRQDQQQKRFPFYYERFKTDGVEHNIYIGPSIAPDLTYDSIFLENLRLWQLRVLCEIELAYKKYQHKLNFNLDVTSLVLVYSSPITIRFRMDEKHFDVDGSYNARYEMIKKRIDKSTIKDSSERVTQPGKISIVYSQDKEREDYLKLIQILQRQQLLNSDIEDVEIEDLQGVNGLRALRVGINYHATTVDYDFVEDFN